MRTLTLLLSLLSSPIQAQTVLIYEDERTFPNNPVMTTRVTIRAPYLRQDLISGAKLLSTTIHDLRGGTLILNHERKGAFKFNSPDRSQSPLELTKGLTSKPVASQNAGDWGRCQTFEIRFGTQLLREVCGTEIKKPDGSPFTADELKLLMLANGVQITAEQKPLIVVKSRTFAPKTPPTLRRLVKIKAEPDFPDLAFEIPKDYTITSR